MSIHDGHRSRTKREFMARPDSFPDHKLLEILLYFSDPRGDTNPTAHALMDRFNSLSGVLDALPADLMKVPGVGEHTVVLLKVAKELSGRYMHDRTDMTGQVLTIQEMAELFHPYFFGARSERVCLLCLDGKRKNLGVRLVGEGNVNAAEVTPRNVVETALSLNASYVVLAHNHVSGVALPSEEDKLTTQHLAKILMSVNVELWDHMIFSDDDMVSLRQSGFPFFV